VEKNILLSAGRLLIVDKKNDHVDLGFEILLGVNIGG
jgi:hypothetical protein